MFFMVNHIIFYFYFLPRIGLTVQVEIFPKFLFEGNERHLKFKNIILRCIIFFHCIPQRKKTSSIVSQNGKKPLPLYPTMEKTSSFVSHNEKNLFRCIPQWRKIFSIVGYNERKPAALWDTMLKIFWDTVHCIRFCCGVGYNGSKMSCIVEYI